MSIPLTVNGQVFDYPQTGDVDWGPEATDWATAITNGTLQKAGGLFQILAELDFGTAAGIKSLYYKTRGTDVATTGQFRLGNNEEIAWRDSANTEDLVLKVNASDVLEFDGAGISVGGDPIQTEINPVDTATIDMNLVSGDLSANIITGSIVDSLISASAAIAYSKLALSGSIVNADISGSAAIAYAKLNLAGAILNADISASAAIANSKLATMANNTIKGNISGGAAVPSDLTTTQVTAALDVMVGDSGSGGSKGLVPAPASGDAAAGKVLFASGLWDVPAGGGDVVGPASATDNGFVRFDGVTGKLIKNSPATIVNADISASAAIAYSKLNLTGSIVNADVNASAAIAVSKLAALTNNRAVATNASGFLTVATTTDVELSYVNGVTSAIQTQIDTKTTNPMSAAGQMIAGGLGGAPSVVAAGTTGQVLYSNGTSAPAFAGLPAATAPLNQATAVLTPATGTGGFKPLTSNSITLIAGRTYMLSGYMNFNAAGNPGYTEQGFGFYSSNTATPTTLDVTANLTLLSGPTPVSAAALFCYGSYGSGAIGTAIQTVSGIIVSVSANVTIYVVPYISCTTPANARIAGGISALRLL